MRFAIDGWDPSYGTSLAIDGAAETVLSVQTDVEVAPEQWSPIAPRAVSAPRTTVFVDGVRRIDARVWIDTDDGAGEASMAICASYAAGAVCCCDGRAHVLDPEIRRGLFTAATKAIEIKTSAGSHQLSYPVHVATVKESLGLAMSLSAALQRELASLELIAAVQARSQIGDHPADEESLLVVDGPVRGREHLTRVLGFIKSHLIAYLPPELNAMVATLGADERTPVFLLGTSWDRYTWYLRLPCPPGQPWAGIARVECATNIPAEEAIELATLSQAVLSRFASEEYKDPRAPQNLYPVGGLERELRHRLGSSEVLYRALRSEAFKTTGSTMKKRSMEAM